MAHAQPAEEQPEQTAHVAQALPVETPDVNGALPTFRHLKHFLEDRNLSDGVRELGPLILAGPKAPWWWFRPEMDDVEEVHRRLTDATSMSIDAEDLNLRIGLRTTGLRITLPIR